MSQAEIETLQAVYEAISRGDWEAAFRDAGPDFEFIPPDQNPIAGTYRGGEAVRDFFAELWAAFEEVTIEPGPFLATDDSIVVFPAHDPFAQRERCQGRDAHHPFLDDARR